MPGRPSAADIAWDVILPRWASPPIVTSLASAKLSTTMPSLGSRFSVESLVASPNDAIDASVSVPGRTLSFSWDTSTCTRVPAASQVTLASAVEDVALPAPKSAQLAGVYGHCCPPCNCFGRGSPLFPLPSLLLPGGCTPSRSVVSR